MDPKIKIYILKQSDDRHDILSSIHRLVLDSDHSVTSDIELMMGKEMIVYKAANSFKYGLSSVKGYMSFHALPIYVSKTLFDKYKTPLPKAAFQKGCINFKTAENLSLEILREMIIECSAIDLAAVRKEQLAKRKAVVKPGKRKRKRLRATMPLRCEIYDYYQRDECLTTIPLK